jgi:hypothetical protein
VTKQSSGVGKTSDFVASRFKALVWSLMLVHVLAVRWSVYYQQLWKGLHLLPFARSAEDMDLLGTFWVRAIDLIPLVAWRLAPVDGNV